LTGFATNEVLRDHLGR
jgi:hypothetical protein